MIENNFLYYKVLLSDQPPACNLQPASLVVPPCQDIAYHIPNQEDNKVVKKIERERLRHHHHATAHPSIDNYPSLFQKK